MPNHRATCASDTRVPGGMAFREGEVASCSWLMVCQVSLCLSKYPFSRTTKRKCVWNNWTKAVVLVAKAFDVCCWGDCLGPEIVFKLKCLSHAPNNTPAPRCAVKTVRHEKEVSAELFYQHPPPQKKHPRLWHGPQCSLCSTVQFSTVFALAVQCGEGSLGSLHPAIGEGVQAWQRWYQRVLHGAPRVFSRHALQKVWKCSESSLASVFSLICQWGSGGVWPLYWRDWVNPIHGWVAPEVDNPLSDLALFHGLCVQERIQQRKKLGTLRWREVCTVFTLPIYSSVCIGNWHMFVTDGCNVITGIF